MSKHLQLYSPLELMINYGQKFSSLLPSDANSTNKASYTSVNQDGQLMFFKSNEKDLIKTISKWTEAYEIFVAILAEKYPHEIANLMLYAKTVQQIAESCGDQSRRKVSSLETERPIYMSLATKKMQSFIRKHWSWDWIIN